MTASTHPETPDALANIRPGDRAYECYPVRSGPHPGFAYPATVSNVSPHHVDAFVGSQRVYANGYDRFTGRRFSRDTGSRCYLSQALPDGFRLLETEMDRRAREAAEASLAVAA